MKIWDQSDWGKLDIWGGNWNEFCNGSIKWGTDESTAIKGRTWNEISSSKYEM